MCAGRRIEDELDGAPEHVREGPAEEDPRRMLVAFGQYMGDPISQVREDGRTSPVRPFRIERKRNPLPWFVGASSPIHPPSYISAWEFAPSDVLPSSRSLLSRKLVSCCLPSCTLRRLFSGCKEPVPPSLVSFDGWHRTSDSLSNPQPGFFPKRMKPVDPRGSAFPPRCVRSLPRKPQSFFGAPRR